MPLSRITGPSIANNSVIIEDFASARDTAVYSPAANTVAIRTANTDRARMTSTGLFLLGTNTNTNNLRVQQNFASVVAGSGVQNGISVTSYSGTGSEHTIVDFQRSRGITDGSMTKIESGDRIASLVFRGSDGSSFVDAGYISGEADGATGSGDMPGRLIFCTTPDASGTSLERMRINSSGIVTKPFTPAFQATGVGAIFNSSSWAKLPYTTEVYDNGSVYTPASSRFTAPVAGIYEFSWSVLHRNANNGSRTALYKNGSKYYDSGNGNSSQTYSSVNSEVMIGATVVLPLAANDYVEIFGIVGNSIGDLYLSSNSHNQFTGFLIG